MNKKGLLINKLFILANLFDHFKNNKDYMNMMAVISRMRIYHGKMIHKLFHLQNKICLKENEESSVKSNVYYQLSIYTTIINKIEKMIMDCEKTSEDFAKQLGQQIIYPMSLVQMVNVVENPSYIMTGGGNDDEDGINSILSKAGDALFDENKPTLALFYTNWCGYSQQFLPIWNEFETKYKNKDINIVKIDADIYKGFTESMGIEGFPTVKLIIENNIYTFNDNRTKENLEKFVNEHKKKKSKK